MNSRQIDSLPHIYLLLKITYGVVPIVAGLDKFVGLLADWDTYLPPFLLEALPISGATFMMIVGGIEVIAGLAVLSNFTRLGAHVVMAWLLLIAVTLVFAGYFDIAVRDIVMAVGAYTLGQLAAARGDAWLPQLSTDYGLESHAKAQ